MLSLERAGRWFLNSGIQEASGGVARYYRIDLDRNAPVSTEITGYACAALLYMAERTGDAAFRDAALRAGRFLTQCAWDSKAAIFPFETPPNGDNLAYFFDSGIIARSLMALCRVTKGTEFQDAAFACAVSMARQFQCGNCWYPVIALKDKRPLPFEPRWSRTPGCYQLKAALPWLDSGDTASYEAMLAFCLRDHETFLPGADNPALVMDRLHAYSYFLEGLLPVAARPECDGVLARGIERVAKLLRQIRPVFERSDVYAQLLRVRLYAAGLGLVPLDTAAATEEAEAIPTFQIASSDSRTDGAFSFGRKDGRLMPYANPVSTAFCIQVSEMWKDHCSGRFVADWRLLI